MFISILKCEIHQNRKHEFQLHLHRVHSIQSDGKVDSFLRKERLAVYNRTQTIIHTDTRRDAERTFEFYFIRY